ncbi:MAG: hypothetical protein LBF77_04525 [Spirochaetaceae bacterium]|jgi:hypothetical protein|nr:hypothetical protein [Spirochaetaceae bacterium]
MKKILFRLLVLLAAVSLIAGCATFATNREVPQKTWPILSIVPNSSLPPGTEMASYYKVIGICLGYDDFVAAVAGKDYDVVEKWYVFFNKVSAIAK